MRTLQALWRRGKQPLTLLNGHLWIRSDVRFTSLRGDLNHSSSPPLLLSCAFRSCQLRVACVLVQASPAKKETSSFNEKKKNWWKDLPSTERLFQPWPWNYQGSFSHSFSQYASSSLALTCCPEWLWIFFPFSISHYSYLLQRFSVLDKERFSACLVTFPSFRFSEKRENNRTRARLTERETEGNRASNPTMWRCGNTMRTVRSAQVKAQAQTHGRSNSCSWRVDGGRKLVRTFASKTWYEEKYERGFQKSKGRERVYTGRQGDDSLKVQLVQWYVQLLFLLLLLFCFVSFRFCKLKLFFSSFPPRSSGILGILQRQRDFSKRGWKL